jgi:hypothetical protein
MGEELCSFEEALLLSRQLRCNRGIWVQITRLYWSVSFLVTRFIERFISQERGLGYVSKVLNFGCGVRFCEGAINSDVFAIHRFVQGKKRPDLYWTGTTLPPYLISRFDGVCCEHVIEHMLPDDTIGLFKNLRQVLSNTGVLVVSFPDVGKLLSGGLCQGYRSTVVSLNSLVYCHGHTFMYDTDIVEALLRAAGFTHMRTVGFHELPLQNYFGQGRAAESSYVVATCAKSA